VGVTTDLGSNVYVAGYYTNSGTSAVNLLTYNSVPQSSGYTLAAASAQGAYFVKYSPSGSPLLFTVLSGTGACAGFGVAVDAGSNIYVTGYYTSSGTVTINNLALNSTPQSSGFTLPSSTSNGMFLIKYSSTGSVISFTYLSSTNTIQGLYVNCDAGSNVYVSGFYSGTTPTVNTLTTSPITAGFTMTSGNSYFLKYGPAGGVPSYSSFVTGTFIFSTIAIDAGSNVYVGGGYDVGGPGNYYSFQSSSTPTAAGTFTNNSSTSSVYLLKFRPDGSVTMIFNPNIGSNTLTTKINAVSTDANSNVYVFGYSPAASSLLGATFTGYFFFKANPAFTSIFYSYSNLPLYFSSLTTDGSNVYAYGYNSSSSTVILPHLNSSLPFLPNATLPNGSGTFLLNYSSNGSLLSYNFIAGGQNPAVQSNSLVVVDSGSNVYVGGLYSTSGTCFFSNALSLPPTAGLSTSSGQNAMFNIFYDPTGTLFSFNQINGTGACTSRAVSVDLGSNIYMTGSYTSTSNLLVSNPVYFTIASSGINLPSSTQNAVFLTEYAPSGAVLGLTNLSGSGACVGQGLAVDGLSNVYLTGYYTNTGTSAISNVTPSSTRVASGYTLSASTQNGVFLIKYSNVGNVLSFTNLTGSGACQGFGLATDASSNVFLTGQYTATGGTTINTLVLNSTPQSSGFYFPAAPSAVFFTLEYNSSGTPILLSSIIGSGVCQGRAVTVDLGSNIYTTGSYISTSNVVIPTVPVSTYSIPSTTQNAVFLINYGTNGNVISYTNMTGSGACVGQGLAVDSLSNVYLTGYYTNTGTTSLNNLVLNSTPQSSGQTLPVSSVQSLFVTKYSNTGSVLGSTTLSGTGSCAGLGIACDASSNVIVCGQYATTSNAVVNTLGTTPTAYANLYQTSGWTCPLILSFSPSGSVNSYTSIPTPNLRPYFVGGSTPSTATFQTVTTDASSNIYTFGNIGQTPVYGNAFIVYTNSNATPYNITLPQIGYLNGGTQSPYISYQQSSALKLGPSGTVAPPIFVTLQTPSNPTFISAKKLYNTGLTPLNMYVNNVQTTVTTKQTWEWVTNSWILTQ
jgi:hypothetical protein